MNIYGWQKFGHEESNFGVAEFFVGRVLKKLASDKILCTYYNKKVVAYIFPKTYDKFKRPGATVAIWHMGHTVNGNYYIAEPFNKYDYMYYQESY